MKVYRFQGTEKIETNSYFEDIMNIWFLVDGYKENYKEEELSFVMRDIFNDNIETLSLRENISAEKLFNKIICCKSENEAWNLGQKYKVSGVFAINSEKIGIDDAFDLSTNPQLGLKNDYLIEAEATLIKDFGKEYGLLVNIDKIININKTPDYFVKKKKLYK